MSTKITVRDLQATNTPTAGQVFSAGATINSPGTWVAPGGQGSFPPGSVIAGTNNIVRYGNTGGFTVGTHTFINGTVLQAGIYTFTISGTGDPFNAQYVINGVPNMIIPASLSFSVNLSLNSGDTIQRQALQGSGFYTGPGPYAMRFNLYYGYFLT